MFIINYFSFECVYTCLFIQIKYKEDFENNKGQMIGTTVTMDMERAKELEPIKKQKYEADAKAALAHTKVKAGNGIIHN